MGSAEAIRICLHAGGEKLLDTRISEWPGVTKATTPLGFIQLLKIDDVSHCRCVSLSRYAAKFGGLYPQDDPLQALECDEAAESLNELIANVPSRNDPEEQASSVKIFKIPP